VCEAEQLELVKIVIRSGWLTTGSYTGLLEEIFSLKVGAQYAFAVNSFAAALHLGLEAVGVSKGDKVLVPTMASSSSAEAVRYLDADPVFLDVEYGSTLVTPEILMEAVQTHPEVKAFIPVHFAGQAVKMIYEDGKGILDFCQRNGIRVVEDAAHAFPARTSGRMVGSIGDVTCFSFHDNKAITTGEGGMCTTDDEGIGRRIKVMRLHGINRDVWDRYLGHGATWEYDVVAPGYKYNMPDLNAVIGLSQLTRADLLRDERQRCAQYYFDRLSGIECLDLPLVQVPMEDHAWHLFVVVINEKSKTSRNDFIDRMAEKGIETSVHFKPLHRMTYYRERYGLKPQAFPGAEKMWRGNVSLPLYPSMTEEDLEYVCSTISGILR